MKRVSILLLLVVASCSPRIVAQRDTVTRVNTEYREILRDTVIYVNLPKESVSVKTMDTLSILDIDYACSTALVSDGVLTHTLSTRDDYRPVVEVQYRDIEKVRDTTIYVTNVDVQYKEKELTWWQKAKMNLGIAYIITTALAILLAAYKAYRRIRGM